MPKEITKRSKATYYKHRLDRALTILEDVKLVAEGIDPYDIDEVENLLSDLGDIMYDIDKLKEDIDHALL